MAQSFTPQSIDKCKTKPPKFILSLDGGGVRGYFTAHFLALIEQELKVDLRDHVDLVAGCSIGSGLAAFIMSPERRDSIDSLFDLRKMEAMMDRSIWDNIMKNVQFQPVFDGQGKTQVLKQVFGDMRLRELKGRVVITAYNITEGQCELFTNYDRESKDYTVVDAVDASSAAPGYFPGCTPTGIDPPAVYIDGGIGASNPVLTAFTEAKRSWPEKDQSFKVLSIGTGIQATDEDWKSPHVRNWGIIPWFMNGFMDLIFTAPNQHIMQCTSQLVSYDNDHNLFLRINENIPKINMDQATQENLDLLKATANHAFQKHKRELKAFFQSKCTTSVKHFTPRMLPRKLKRQAESLGSLC